MIKYIQYTVLQSWLMYFLACVTSKWYLILKISYKYLRCCRVLLWSIFAICCDCWSKPLLRTQREWTSVFISFIFLIYFTAFVEGAAIGMWEELQVSARKQDWKGVGGHEKLVIFFKTLSLRASFQVVLCMEGYRLLRAQEGTIIQQPFQVTHEKDSCIQIGSCTLHRTNFRGPERSCCLKDWAERSQPIRSLGKRVILILKEWDKLSVSNQTLRPQ